jgi:AdoMet dependent proline di-methyltransferase
MDKQVPIDKCEVFAVAGVGRVTATTLLPLFSDVVLLEPVESLLDAAASQGVASKTYSRNDSEKRKWRGIADYSKCHLSPGNSTSLRSYTSFANSYS